MPDSWIIQAERYFQFYNLIEEVMEAIVVSVEGDALLWFQWEHQQQSIIRWEELKGFILR